jgi:hypothetical protein
MAQFKLEDIAKRCSDALTKKEQWRSIYEDCYEFAMPSRNIYDGGYENRVGGQNKMARVFDSTAIHSTHRFANRLQSGLFPPYSRWCRLEAGPEIPPERKDEAQAALDIYNEKMFSVLRQTNFDLAMGEFLLDLCAGTAAMIIQPGDAIAPIKYQTVPPFLLGIEEGANGVIDNVYRRLRIKGEAIKREWPDAKIPDDLQKKIDKKPTEEIELREATVLHQETGRFEYWLWHEKDKQRSEIVQRDLKKGSPWIVARYMKMAGEAYGRGPLVTAIPDIKTLNKTVELLLKNASLAIAGVYTAADDGILNPQTVRITPGAVIPVARNGGPQGASLAPLPRAGDFNVTQLVLQDLRMNVKRMLLDDTLPPDTASARSATEIAERMKELATNLGAAFGRLITETMQPVVRRTLEIMDERGLIVLPLKVNGLEVKVVPVSPIAKAQNLEDVQNVLQWHQVNAALGPGAAMTENIEAISDFVGDRLGVPANLRTTPEQRDQAKKAAMEMAKQAAMSQMAGAAPGGAAPAGGGAGPSIDPTGAMAPVMV